MNRNFHLYARRSLILLAAISILRQTAAQQTTAFTYQGQLRDGGTNANGSYTMTFKLYESATGTNQVGGTITGNLTLANGLFTVNLDFGLNAFNGGARWLDITVTQGSDTQTLSPRVQVLPAPYALFATTAGTVTNGAIMSAQLAADPGSISRVTAGAAFTTINSLTGDPTMAFSGGLLTLAHQYPFPTNFFPVPPYITNGWSGLSVFKFVNGWFVGVASNPPPNPSYVHSYTPILDITQEAATDYLVTITPATNEDLITSHVQAFPRLGNVYANKFIGNGVALTNVSAVPRIQSYMAPGTYEFVVPPNVTRIMVEMWGGGGGGGNFYQGDPFISFGGGGGGGGYIQHSFDVVPGSTNFIQVGQGGNAGQNGTDTTLTNLPIALLAGGGRTGTDGTEATDGVGGEGGIAQGAPIAVRGQHGQPTEPAGDYSYWGGASFRSVLGGLGSGATTRYNPDPVGENGALFIYY